MIKDQGGEVTNLPLDFSSNEFQPLAAKMRPINLEQYIGPLHLLAKDKPLARAIGTGQLHSMILWGPPGIGKRPWLKLSVTMRMPPLKRFQL